MLQIPCDFAERTLSWKNYVVAMLILLKESLKFQIHQQLESPTIGWWVLTITSCRIFLNMEVDGHHAAQRVSYSTGTGLFLNFLESCSIVFHSAVLLTKLNILIKGTGHKQAWWHKANQRRSHAFPENPKPGHFSHLQLSIITWNKGV